MGTNDVTSAGMRKSTFGRNVVQQTRPRIPQSTPKDIKIFPPSGGTPGHGGKIEPKDGQHGGGPGRGGQIGPKDGQHGGGIGHDDGRHGGIKGHDGFGSKGGAQSIWTQGNNTRTSGSGLFSFNQNNSKMNHGNLVINSVIKANTGHANSNFLNNEWQNFHEIKDLGTDYSNYLGTFGGMC